MAWLVALALFALVAATLLLGRMARVRAARRGWRRWDEQRRSGALAWTLFRRRQRLPRLTDGRDPKAR